MKNTTPIRRQYLEIKSNHQDSILLFRLGDFYEAFDEDAKLLSRELDITLTSKPMGKNMRVPLAGIPHQVLDKHLATLISRGHKVAICEQTGTQPVKGADGKKLIPREVVRVVTAGTIIEPELLDSKTNNYLVSFYSDGTRTGIAYADISTGDFAATEVENKNALTELQRLAPAEILISEGDPEMPARERPQNVTRLNPVEFDLEKSKKTIFRHFKTKSLRAFGLDQKPLAVSAVGALLSYLKNNRTETAEQLSRLAIYDSGEFMLLDGKTLDCLEVFKSDSGNSLLNVIDKTQTPMGGRLLRRWLRQPLLDVSEIFRRQELIGWLAENSNQRQKLSGHLELVKDIERLSGRAKAGVITPTELLAFGNSLDLIPKIKNVLRKDPVKFSSLLAQLPECKGIADLINAGISRELPSDFAEQVGIIKPGFSEELDKLRNTLGEGKTFLAELEKRERKRTGIKSLRVGFNKVFGYYIEVTKPNLHLVPKDFQRKQTLIPSERFITLELKEHESLVIHTQERIAELESSLLRQICNQIGKSRPEILLAGSTLALLDCVSGLAETADLNSYCRPTVNETSLLRIKAGRHPVIEKVLQNREKAFVPNDAALGGNGAPLIALITGPNASGKSTYLRQIAQIVLLAQIGSFVPADEAVVGICDRIFTRIGLYDRLGSGESTFMTEMIETAEILHNATPRSLVLLDELGRGTSTYDGLAVARAVVEYLHNHSKLKPRTLFATHYHELAELEEILPDLENYYFLIDDSEKPLKFKYQIKRGTALRSYGIFAAQLAGLPKPVTRRAFELLSQYQKEQTDLDYQTHSNENSELAKKLASIDPENLSPVEALMKIYELKKILRAERANENPLELKKMVG
ncbi:MAG: DNA mismatch repair protein MutS [Pyrinomonadaceae bacterium]